MGSSVITSKSTTMVQESATNVMTNNNSDGKYTAVTSNDDLVKDRESVLGSDEREGLIPPPAQNSDASNGTNSTMSSFDKIPVGPEKSDGGTRSSQLSDKKSKTSGNNPEQAVSHQGALAMVCRICGIFIKEKSYRTFLTSEKSACSFFKDLWNIDLDKEDKTIYPVGLCRTHISLCKKYEENETFGTRVKPISFEAHSSDCNVCEEVKTKQVTIKRRSAFVRHKSKVVSSQTFVKGPGNSSN